MLDELFARVLRPFDPPLSYETTSDWWQDFRETSRGLELPVDQAIASAARADRLAYVLAAGYAASVRRVFPTLPAALLVSFAVSEEGGVHPRAIRTTLEPAGDGWMVSGAKRWVTLGMDADRVLVAARAGETDARPNIKVVLLDPRAAGVERVAMAATPFVSELANAELRIEGQTIRSADVLEGDGYQRYVKPFRTVEDLHVHAAILGWTLAMASRYRWPRERREALLAHLVAARGLCTADPASPLTHIAVSGLLREGESLIERCEDSWAASDPHIAALWQRDRTLLRVAQDVRAVRRGRAWAAVEGESLVHDSMEY